MEKSFSTSYAQKKKKMPSPPVLIIIRFFHFLSHALQKKWELREGNSHYKKLWASFVFWWKAFSCQSPCWVIGANRSYLKPADWYKYQTLVLMTHRIVFEAEKLFKCKNNRTAQEQFVLFLPLLSDDKSDHLIQFLRRSAEYFKGHQLANSARCNPFCIITCMR